MTYDGVDIGEAVQPIQDRVETYQSNGYAVVSPGDALSAGGYAVTVNSGNLDASDTLSVGSSSDEVLFNGSTKSLSSSTNVRINSVSAAGDGTEQYRYDVIYADSSGEVQKTEGSVTKLDSRESQNNLTRFERFKAAIPNPGTDPSVIIAAVIVNSNDTGVGTSQLRDYRVSATHKVSALEATDTQTDQIWFGDLSQTASDPDIITFNSKGSGSGDAARPMTGIATSGLTGVAGDNSANDLLNLDAKDLNAESASITVVIRRNGAADFRIDEIRQADRSTRDTSTTASGNPGATSYSNSGATLQIAINDSGESYDIIAIAIGGGLSG